MFFVEFGRMFVDRVDCRFGIMCYVCGCCHWCCDVYVGVVICEEGN